MKQINNTIDLKEEKKKILQNLEHAKSLKYTILFFFPLCHPRPIVEGLNKSFTVRITIRIFSFGAWKSRIYRLVVSNQLFIRHGPFECKRTSSRAIFPSPLSLFLFRFIFRTDRWTERWKRDMNRGWSGAAWFAICIGSRN